MNARELKVLNDKLCTVTDLLFDISESVDFSKPDSYDRSNEISNHIDAIIASISSAFPELEWHEMTFEFVGKSRECTCGSGMGWQDCGLTNFCG